MGHFFLGLKSIVGITDYFNQPTSRALHNFHNYHNVHPVQPSRSPKAEISRSKCSLAMILPKGLLERSEAWKHGLVHGFSPNMRAQVKLESMKAPNF